MNTIVWPPQPKILGSATNWKETKDLKKHVTFQRNQVSLLLRVQIRYFLKVLVTLDISTNLNGGFVFYTHTHRERERERERERVLATSCINAAEFKKNS